MEHRDELQLYNCITPTICYKLLNISAGNGNLTGKSCIVNNMMQDGSWPLKASIKRMRDNLKPQIIYLDSGTTILLNTDLKLQPKRITEAIDENGFLN